MPLKTRTSAMIAAIVVVAGVGYAYLTGTDRNGNASDPATVAALIATGETVYAKHCASCHGADLAGQDNWQQRKADGRLPAPPHDQTGHTWHHPDPVLFALTKFGPAAMAGEGYQSDMPGYADILSDEEIVAVLEYIKSTWPPEVRQEQERRTRAYHEQ